MPNEIELHELSGAVLNNGEQKAGLTRLTRVRAIARSSPVHALCDAKAFDMLRFIESHARSAA